MSTLHGARCLGELQGNEHSEHFACAAWDSAAVTTTVAAATTTPTTASKQSQLVTFARSLQVKFAKVRHNSLAKFDTIHRIWLMFAAIFVY